jgi:hypothetical protein
VRNVGYRFVPMGEGTIHDESSVDRSLV